MKDYNTISRNIWREIRKETPFEQPEPDPEYTDKFYEGSINLPLLLEFIKTRYKTDIFNWEEFKAPGQYVENTDPDNPGYTQSNPGIPFSYTSEQTGERKAYFKVKLNQGVNYLESDYNKFGFMVYIDPKSESIFARLTLYYHDTQSKRRPTKGSAEIPDQFTIDNQYRAIEISTSNLTDYCYLMLYLYGKDTFDEQKDTIGKIFARELKETETAKELNFLYENIPDFAFEDLNKTVSPWAYTHLKKLKAYDDTGTLSFARDSSGAIINLLRIIGNSTEIYNYFLNFPNLVKELYNNMDGESSINGIQQKNRMLFANLLFMLCMANGYQGSGNTGAQFYLGQNYKLDSNLFPGNDKEKSKIFLQQFTKKWETQTIVVYDDLPSKAERISTPIAKFQPDNDGSYFYPLDPVTFIDMDSKDKTPYLVPAIFVKAISDEAEWKDIQKNIRIGANILAIILGVASLGSSSPLIVTLAAVDIGLATTDTLIALNEDELMKSPEGKKFLETWNQIYLIGGLATATPLLVSSTFRAGTKLLTLAKNANTRMFLKSCLLKVILETNIHNFTQNTVKILETKTEIITATRGHLNDFRIGNFQEAGAVLLSGEVKTGNKTVTEYALAYKGEIVAQGEWVEFHTKIRKLTDVWGNPEKLVKALDNLTIYGLEYPVRKLQPLVNAAKARRSFGMAGEKLVKEVDREVNRILNTHSKDVINEKVMISGMIYNKGIKTEISFSSNFLREEIAKGKGIAFTNFIQDMHPTLKKRFDKHVSTIKAKNVKASESDILRAGWAGSHGEIRALDALLKKIDPLGILGEQIFSDITAYNQFLRNGADKIQPPCVHCYYITKGINFIGF